MFIGFTGTRNCPTDAQIGQLYDLLVCLQPTVGRHGDCIGADDAFANMLKAHWPTCQIIVHPPLDQKLRAYNKGHLELSMKSYFARNRDIVDMSQVLLALPYEESHQDRGGTWYTIDYAVKRKKPVGIIFSSGRLCALLPPEAELQFPELRDLK